MKELIIYTANQIPYGKVSSYGDLATQINNIYIINGQDLKTNGRLVGRLLSNMPESERKLLPRHRIINAKGYISSLKLGAKGILQIQLLREEGINVSDGGIIDMTKYRFQTL